MKRLIVSLFAVFLLAGGIFTSHNAGASVFDDKGKITAEASEFKYISPDTATITFSVETSDKNSQKAVDLNNQKMSVITENVKKLLAANESVRTASYNLRQRYEYNNVLKKSVQTGYTVNNTLTVTLKDTKKTAKVIDAATQNGATSVSGLSFSVQNTDGVCKELTTKAAQKAKREAEQVLVALGKSIDSVVSVSYSCNTQFHHSPVRMMAMDMESNAKTAARAPIEEGENKITAYVTVIFTIK